MSNKENKESANLGIYTSEPIYLDVNKLDVDFYRADLEFHNVDHSYASYSGRVFLNNPDANENTELSIEEGYVGSYHVFGHGGCVGNLGHCDILPPRAPYDKRPSQDLKPQYKRIIITESLKKIGKNKDNFTVTVVPVLPNGNHGVHQDVLKDLVKFDNVSIITYD